MKGEVRLKKKEETRLDVQVNQTPAGSIEIYSDDVCCGQQDECKGIQGEMDWL